VADTEFAVVYDGPSLTDGLMPVRDLAPALLALGDLFVEASRVTYPDRDPVGLNIKATSEGSFLVQLVIHSPDTWDQVRDLLSGTTLVALVNLKELIVGARVGLFWLIQRLHGRRIVQRDTVDSAHVRLTLDDQTTVDVPAGVLSLYETVSVRRTVRQVVEPVKRPGIRQVRFVSDEQVTVEVGEPELPAYDVPELEEILLTEYEQQTVVAVATASFEERYKWRLTEGEAGVN
jgi:hypothetical protein